MTRHSFILPNGLHVTLIPNSALPIVKAQGWMRGGFALDARQWVGRLVPPMLKRGTLKHSKEEFEDMLDEHALLYNAGASSISNFFVEWSGRALGVYLKELLALACESLRFPSFPDEELSVLKKQREAGICKNDSDPAYRASNEVLRMLYGPSHPRFPLKAKESIAQLKAVRAEDLQSFWERHYSPGQSGLVVVGDMNVEDARSDIKDIFGEWVGAENSGDGYSYPDDNCETERYEERVVFMPEKASAVLEVGQRLPISSVHPDYPALRTAVGILGGGMSSRLFKHVRAKHGLSYHVSASLDGVHTLSGYFSLFAYTNPDNIQKTQQETLRVLIEFCEEGVTSGELENTKAVLRGSRASQLSSLGGVAQDVVSGKIIGMPSGELEGLVQELSVEEVNLAIRRYINFNKMKVVRAGTVS